MYNLLKDTCIIVASYLHLCGVTADIETSSVTCLNTARGQPDVQDHTNILTVVINK